MYILSLRRYLLLFSSKIVSMFSWLLPFFLIGSAKSTSNRGVKMLQGAIDSCLRSMTVILSNVDKDRYSLGN